MEHQETLILMETLQRLGSNARIVRTIEEMLYYNIVEEGWRGDGWYEIDGSEDVGEDSDTDWYFFDDGERLS